MKSDTLHNFSLPAACKAGILSTALSCILFYYLSDTTPQIFTKLDTQITDFMFTLRGPEDSSGAIVIVDIDERSLRDFGQWPWPRDLVGELSKSIIASRPIAVGFDLMFAEKDRCSPTAFIQRYGQPENKSAKGHEELFGIRLSNIPDTDTGLGKILAKSQFVQGYRFLFREDFEKEAEEAPYFSTKLTISNPDVQFDEVQLISAYRPILNIPEIRTGHREGFLNLFHDNSGTVRKTPLYLLLDDVPYPSLTMAMFQSVKQTEVPTLGLANEKEGKYYPVESITLGAQQFKTDAFGQLNINFRGPSNTFLYFSASDILDGSATPFIKGKYVLIGSTASGSIDLISTPFSSRIPGVEIHANILDNLLQHDALVSDENLEQILSYTALVVGGITLSVVLVFLHPLLGLTLSLLFFIGLGWANYYFLFLHEQLMGFSVVFFLLITIFILVTLCNYFFEGKKRSFIKRAFSHYVSPSVVGELMRHPERLDLLVDTREVSVLFCDIRDFTTLAETTSPADLSLFLNNYFSLLTDIIIKHNGMVDKYIGDAIMAVWGTPLEDTNHAKHAVNAALEMVEAINSNQDTLILSGKRIRVGIGINSGMVSAGNFGCSRRFDYTVLGDNVNLASRIEGITKYYPANILMSQSTTKKIENSINHRFIDTVQVKGRQNPVDLFEPLPEATINKTKEAEITLYMEAIKNYKRGAFNHASYLFGQLFAVNPDPLYEMYRKRCIHLECDPPPEEWTGVYHHG